MRFLRHERGWSQRALGRLTGHSQAQICLFEQGRLLPTTNDLERIARALGVDVPITLMDEVSVKGREEATA